jgi:hypothetical protein
MLRAQLAHVGASAGRAVVAWEACMHAGRQAHIKPALTLRRTSGGPSLPGRRRLLAMCCSSASVAAPRCAAVMRP